MATARDGPRRLVLASSSPYRRKLLSRLGIPFTCDAPRLDESALAGEEPARLALRLARDKARAVAARHPDSLVVGSDQVAELDGRALGKPGTTELAVEQLAAASGRELLFHTGLCLINTASGREHSLVDPYRVRFRQLTREQVERYVAVEQPLDCAGSFKAEGLGIVLFESLHGKDPNTLVGLPLIELVGLLAGEGWTLPLAQ